MIRERGQQPRPVKRQQPRPVKRQQPRPVKRQQRLVINSAVADVIKMHAYTIVRKNNVKSELIFIGY